MANLKAFLKPDAPTKDMFGRQVIVQPTLVTDAVPTYGISALRNVTTLAGSATVDESGGEGVITLTASGSDSAIVDTAVRFRYSPGRSGQMGAGVRIPTAPTGSQVFTWGMFDTQNGFYFGRDATGMYVAVLHAGVETKTRQASWNVDKADGTTSSGADIENTLENGGIFNIDFAWYGYGVIEFSFYDTTTAGVPRRTTIHRVFNYSGLSIVDPQVPLRVKAANGGTATGATVYFGGRQFSNLGDMAPIIRVGSVTRLNVAGVGTSFTPLCSFRPKSTFRSRANTVPVVIDGYTSVATAAAVFRIVLAPTLTNASFGAQDGVAVGETAVDVDTSATAFAGGTKVYEDLVASAGAAKASLEEEHEGLRIIVPDSAIVTLVCRAVTGTVDVSGLLRWTEEW